jgi:rsbT co-antagonist protein RsbR
VRTPQRRGRSETKVSRCERSTALDNDILESVADALLVLSNVGFGDYTSRLSIPGEQADPSLRALFEGINEMIRSLEQEKERSDTYQKELEEKLATIEKQRIAIQELSTPIMEVWDGVLCLPVVGVMDTARSAEMTESLLNAVVDKKTRCCIIDITGIEVMDTGTADHFMRMARAVGMLGARCVLTGINPHIAQTIVHMGVDLSGIDTHRSLREALQLQVAREKK